MSDEFDYGDFKDGPGDNLLAQLRGKALDQHEAEKVLAKAEEAVIVAKEALRQIAEIQLPALMDEAEQVAVTTKDGIEIKMAEKVRASIPAKDLTKRATAFRYLDDNGHGNLIKREFLIAFGKDDEKWAAKFKRDLRLRKKPVNCKTKKTVHAQTLTSWVKGQLAEGIAIPLDAFGVHRQRHTKITVEE